MNKFDTKPVKIFAFFVVCTVILSSWTGRTLRVWSDPASSPTIAHGAWAAEVQTNEQPRDIQWFRDQLRISPKYLESHEGILGMSWLHFFTMVFLTLFFVGALLVAYLRSRRTRQILASLLKEEKHGAQS